MSSADKTVYYPYNETFEFYGEPRAGKRAQAFVDFQNLRKGGRWVIHSKEQYKAWYESKGKHIETVKYMKR